ncbi:MAG TPA: hypothetical protein VGQ89_15275 [Candidatus Limnocylindrales bacterium]|nr:hypothetical protein [Candidatus Limnocylindrales bacterium]
MPERYGPWTAVWAQWRRWRANGVWAAAMGRLAAIVRVLHNREPTPSMVMVDAQTVRGARYGPTFHDTGGHGGRTIGTERTLLVEILGLRVTAAACSTRPHDVVAARELLRERVDRLPRLRAIVGERAYRGLAAIARRKGLVLDLKRPPAGATGFVPIRPLYRIEHHFAQLGDGVGCRAATRAAKRAPAPGSKSPRSGISHGARSPDWGSALRSSLRSYSAANFLLRPGLAHMASRFPDSPDPARVELMASHSRSGPLLGGADE